jgi:tetratricopeptide (TPR) repeat protein
MFTTQEMKEMGYGEAEIADIERKNAEVIKKRSAELPTTKDGLEKLFESMPLTATKMPEEENELFEAMKALQKEIPAEERAEALKESGNEAFKLAKTEGAKRYKDAEIYYTQALEVECKDAKLNSQLYSNRALVHLTTGNEPRPQSLLAGSELLLPVAGFDESAVLVDAERRAANYGHCIADCDKAIALQEANVKVGCVASCA